MINVEVRYNDNENDELYCTYDKTRIEVGEKFAYLVVEGTELEKLPYHLCNLPAEEEYDEEIDDPFFGRT
jgi:hypothetical protein